MSRYNWSLLHRKIERIAASHGISEPASAFVYFILKEFFDADFDQAVEYVTDGTQDRGVDAICIRDGKEINILQCKYRNKPEKWANCYPESDLRDIFRFIEDLNRDSIDISSVSNIKLREKIIEISKLRDRRVCKINIVLCSNASGLSQESKNEYKKLITDYGNVEIKEIDLADCISAIIKSVTHDETLPFRATGRRVVEHSDGGIRGIITTIDVFQLVELVRDKNDKNSINKNLLSGNIRLFLGASSAVNGGIRNSAFSENNSRFWFLNNGITAICKELKYDPNMNNPLFEVKGLQIVNGIQTTSTLFQAYIDDPERIKNVLVSIKIIETDDKELADNISISTNSQNRIVSRDTMSNDPIQILLEKTLEDYGISYIRRRGEEPSSDREYVLDSLKAGQILLAYNLKLPYLSKSRSDDIFEGLYRRVFPPDIDVEMLVHAFRVYSQIERLRDRIQEEIRIRSIHDPEQESQDFVIYGSFHILCAIRLIEDERGMKLNFDSESDTEECVSKALLLIRRVVDAYPKLSYYQLFREKEPSDQISFMSKQGDLFTSR